MYQGVQLKVRRPNDYNPDGAPPMGQSIVLRLDALGVIASTVPDGPNKIFVGEYHGSNRARSACIGSVWFWLCLPVLRQV